MRSTIIGQTFMDEIHPHRSRTITDDEASKNARLINLAGELHGCKADLVNRASGDAHPDSLADLVRQIVSIADQMAETLGLVVPPAPQRVATLDDPDVIDADYPDPFEDTVSQSTQE